MKPNRKTAKSWFDNGKISRVEKPAAGLKFDDAGTFIGLDVKVALEVLARAEQTFSGHRQVLFAGLCNWLALPKTPMVAADGMIFEAFRLYADEESKRTPDRKNGTLLLAPFQIAVSQQGLMFKLHHAMGGASAVRQMYERAPENIAALARVKDQLSFWANVARVLHFYATDIRGAGPALRQSYVYAAQATQELKLVRSVRGKVEVQPRSIRDYWQDHHPAVPLIYAASLIKWNKNLTLLDRIADTLTSNRTPLLLKRASVFKQLLEYNSYLVKHVFNETRMDASARASFPVGNVMERTPPPPVFSPDQIPVIKKHFSKRQDAAL